MEGRIAHLRSHYRLLGAQVAAPAMRARLDQLLRDEAIQSYEEALKLALAGDESVYVVRRVKSRTSMVLGAEATDAGLARRWGSQLAAAVMRAIARGEDDAGNVVRFENQADYVASFLVARLKGNEHGQWFYNAFDSVQALDKKTAIRRVLLDNIARAPAILAYVHRYGELDSLIVALDEETKRALWLPESEQRDDLEISRSLFSAAVQFVQKLRGWTGPPPDGELFQSYWDSGPPFADWRDPRSLAESVLEVVRYFFARGYLALSQDVETLSLRLSEALEGFEWLDREWLKSSLPGLFEKQDGTMPDLPLRVSSGRATPRQRELLAAIAGAVGNANVDGDPLAASLKILALLINAAPGWAEDAAAKVMIENLLAARTAVQTASAGGEFLKLLRRRDVEGALRMLPHDVHECSADACRAVAALGEPALALLETLTNAEAKQLTGGLRECSADPCRAIAALGEPALALLQTLTNAEAKQLTGVVESECAGLALLVRVMIDARLHALVDEDSFPVKSEWPLLFLAVALRICGTEAFVNGRLEEGLCLLAGIKQAPASDALDAIWRDAETADYSKFQEALLDIAAAHRLQDVNDGAEARDGFIEPLDFLDSGKTGNPNLDQTVAMVTCLLLRMWARWLRGFSTSSISFLIENFLRRPGRLYAEKDTLIVELERRPFDIVTEMAGYFADLERVPWLPGKRIKFSLNGP